MRSYARGRGYTLRGGGGVHWWMEAVAKSEDTEERRDSGDSQVESALAPPHWE
jgi:hypothetical protein